MLTFQPRIFKQKKDLRIQLFCHLIRVIQFDVEMGPN